MNKPIIPAGKAGQPALVADCPLSNYHSFDGSANHCRQTQEELGHSMNIEETIERANALRDEDELEAAQALLLDLLELHPEDPLVLFEVGGSYDVMGQERQAIPYYTRAIANGLSDDTLQECLVCLGSSLRYTGQFEAAIETLEEAVERFPEMNSSRVFLAMAYYSHERCRDAVQMLLETLLNTTEDEDILAYENALSYYMENLDETDEDLP